MPETNDDTDATDLDDATESYQQVDAGEVQLGPDAIPIDEYLAGPRNREPSPALDPLRYGLGKVALVALAFAVLGLGVGYLWGSRSERPSDVDVGFAQDMIDHHDQAIQMALLVLAKRDIDGETRTFATEVLVFQRWEIGIMDTLLGGWGKPRGDPDRTTMQWMNMGLPLSAMPGIASDDQMETLRTSTGREADRLFLTLMREHHRGGTHMSDYAAEHASSARTRSLAAKMARNQQIEVVEYTRLLQKLGLE